jgi:hypothetical protein
MDRRTLCLLISLVAVTPAWGADAPPRRLAVVITSDDIDAEDPERATMQEELATLWTRYGVSVSWARNTGDEPGADFYVKVVIADGPVPNAKGKPLGAVYRAGPTFRRLIVISKSAIRELVLDSRAVMPESTAFNRLYARFLGRVIAHELGHLLLSSTTHSMSGMMRERYDRRDVLATDHDRFMLYSDQVAVLQRLNAVQIASALEASSR